MKIGMEYPKAAVLKRSLDQKRLRLAARPGEVLRAQG